MRVEALRTAIKEAERFLSAARKVKIKKAEYTASYINKGKPFFETAEQGTKECGACKRASLDLTRALAELRKP